MITSVGAKHWPLLSGELFLSLSTTGIATFSSSSGNPAGKLGFMTMKLALPIWGENISPVFDTASQLQILHLADNEEIFRYALPLKGCDIYRRCLYVKKLGVQLLICGAISSSFKNMLTAAGITVIPWISGPVEGVIQAYLGGRLSQPEFLMPGCQWAGDQVYGPPPH